MKKSIIIVACLTVVALMALAAEKYAQATFPEQSYDFGTIKEEKGPVSQ